MSIVLIISIMLLYNFLFNISLNYRFTGQAVIQISFNGVSVVTSSVVINVTTNCIKVSKICRSMKN